MALFRRKIMCSGHLVKLWKNLGDGFAKVCVPLPRKQETRLCARGKLTEGLSQESQSCAQCVFTRGMNNAGIFFVACICTGLVHPLRKLKI